MRFRRPPNQTPRNTGPANVSRRAVLGMPAIAAVAAVAADGHYAGRVDDLSGLFIARTSTPAQPMSYRVGVVKAWDPLTAENTVTVDGSDFTNLPILNTNEALQLGPGDVVGIMDIGSTWAILGRMTIPGTPDAATVLNMIGFATSDVSTFESTTSGTPVDLATVGPVVNTTIGQSGRCWVTLSASIGWTATTSTGGQMAFLAAGPTPVVVFSGRALRVVFTSASGAEVQASRRILLTGLTPGDYTFTAKYSQIGNVGNTVNFTSRNLSVETY